MRCIVKVVFEWAHFLVIVIIKNRGKLSSGLLGFFMKI